MSIYKERRIKNWLYNGGGGLELDKGDEKSFSCTFDGLVSFLEAYEEYLKEQVKRK